MRIVNGVFCVLMVLFAAVQYNDPDALLWASIYGLAALWNGIAAFRPARLANGVSRGVLAATAAAAAWGVWHYWPQSEHWWWQEVWWVTETAREGMGMMIALVAVLVALIAALMARRPA